jgi:hypothetical protein
MQKEPSVACRERNFARSKVLKRAASNLNFIARPKAGQHAFSVDAEANRVVLPLA